MPVGAYTQFYWTVNARALMNFVSLRNAEFAQLEIRRYAEAVEALLRRADAGHPCGICCKRPHGPLIEQHLMHGRLTRAVLTVL